MCQNKSKDLLKTTLNRNTEAVVLCYSVKIVLINFKKFTGKHWYQGLFLNKVPGLKHVTLLKKRLQQRYFSMNFPKDFVKFSRTPILWKQG